MKLIAPSIVIVTAAIGLGMTMMAGPTAAVPRTSDTDSSRRSSTSAGDIVRSANKGAVSIAARPLSPAAPMAVARLGAAEIEDLWAQREQHRGTVDAQRAQERGAESQGEVLSRLLDEHEAVEARLHGLNEQLRVIGSAEDPTEEEEAAMEAVEAELELEEATERSLAELESEVESGEPGRAQLWLNERPHA